MSQYKDITIESEISKIVLKNIIENKKINYESLGITNIRQKIEELKKNYKSKKKNYKGNINYKYEIFWA